MVNEEPGTRNRPAKPAIASYVSDFLKPDMLHIHRQITGLQAVTPWVLTQKRENAAQFPFRRSGSLCCRSPRLRWWRRFVSKQIKREPWQIFRWVARRHQLLELTRAEAKLLHVYFGPYRGASPAIDQGVSASRCCILSWGRMPEWTCRGPHI